MSSLPPLTPETIWAILQDEIDDDTVNRLVWDCLGYRWQSEAGHEGHWDHSAVASEWREEYPEPPDFIGNRPPTVKLTRSIPKENKQLLKEQLGFSGYQVGQLEPRLTRRAIAANWLLSYMALQTAFPS